LPYLEVYLPTLTEKLTRSRSPPRITRSWPILERREDGRGDVRTGQERRAPERLGSPRRDVPGRRAGVVAGLLGAGVALFTDAILHVIVPAVPFAPISVAQAVIRGAPGAVDAFFIDRFQHLARPVAVAGSVAGFVLLAALLGSALPAVRDRLRSGPAAAAVLSLPLYAVALALYRREPNMVSLPVYAVALLVAFTPSAILSGLAFEAMTRPADDRPPDPLRRHVVNAAWLSAVGVALGWGGAGQLFRRPNPGRLPLRGGDVSPAPFPSPRPVDRAFVSIRGLSPRITTNDRFYVVNEELLYPDVDPATWTLEVGGLVDKPFALTYRQLRSMQAVEQFQTLECVSNKVGGKLISTARWTGVPMKALLDRAGIRTGALEVVSRSVDGYADSIPLGDATRPTTLIAIGMNGQVLPREHGFPARLLAPGYYGMKQPKWLGSIEVVDRPFQGYWEVRGWVKRAVVKTMSRIDTPRSGATVGEALTVAGVAFAGDRGISRVEVSTNGGKTWNDAQLETELSPFTWRRWRVRVRLKGGAEANIVVRATDGTGAVQTGAVTPPEYSGSTGRHEVTVE
jgi:DMSO/TMAO reductase YedYZ molybdopterin-dependent catalytic subunit